MKTKYFTQLLFSFIFCSSISYAQLTKVGKSGNFQELYAQGIKLKDDKKTPEALDKFRQALSINPDFTDALYMAGWCQNELSNYKGAIDYLQKAREVWSAVPKVYFELGYAFEKLNSYDSAVKHYNKCLELKPDYYKVYKQLGYLEYNREDYSSALAQFRKYEANAITEIDDYLYWYRKGYAHNTQKNYADAKTALQKSLAYKTDYISTYLELGFAAAKLKQDDEAIDHFKNAMKIDPKNHVPYNGIAEIYRDNKKDMDQAIAWYRKTLEINSTERKANFGMGYCLNSTQKYTDAIEYLKKAIEKEPTYTAAYTELGYSYFKTGRDADALTQFDKAISLNPNNENARYYACLLYINQKNKVKAQKMLDELKALSSKQVASLQPKVDAL